MKGKPTSEWVAIVLSAAIGLALMVMTVAALVAAFQPDPSGQGYRQLGENATQVLTGWGGGIIGVLGAYVGYSFGYKNGDRQHKPPELPPLPDGPKP